MIIREDLSCTGYWFVYESIAPYTNMTMGWF